MKPRPITKVYIHCSYSSWGTLEDISGWHKDRNFREVKMVNGGTTYCGYHKVIYNGYTSSSLVKNKKLDSFTDGQIVDARPDWEFGAGVKNDNTFSLHVCYIGYTPTPIQIVSLQAICLDWIKRYNIKVEDILGHYEHYENLNLPIIKTCPQFNIPAFREQLKHFL